MYGDVQLYQDDVESCYPGNWMKDSIIEYQYERWERDLFKDCTHIAFVRPALVYLLFTTKSDVGLNLASKTLIFFPINDGIQDQSYGSHWSLLVYKRICNSFYYFDSMGNSNLDIAISFKNAIHNIFPAGSGFVKISTPQQSNGFDCGAFIIAITQILAERSVSYNSDFDVEIYSEKLDAQRMVELRHRVADDIESIAKGASPS